MAAGFVDVVGEAALSSTLALHTDIVSVTKIGGYKEFGSSSYFTGQETIDHVVRTSVTGSDGSTIIQPGNFGFNKLVPASGSLNAAPKDLQVFRVVFNS